MHGDRPEPDPADGASASAPPPAARPPAAPPPVERPRAVPTTTTPLAVADSLTMRSEAAAAVGATMLAGGMASYRVRTAMARTAKALGLDAFLSIVTFTDITATATLNGRYRTRITQPPHVGVNVDHIARAQRMVETLPERVTAAEVFESLALITARRPLYSGLVSALAAGFACAAFSFLNRGGLIEMLCVLVAATLGQAARRVMAGRQWNHLLMTLVAASAASSVYLLLVSAMLALGLTSGDHQGGYLSAVLFLVPGFPMITGLLDIVRADYSAGIARLTYSMMIVAAAAAAVWTVGLGAGLQVGEVHGGPSFAFLPELGLRAVATFVGVLGFAIIFNSPWRIASAAATVSVVANSLRFALGEVQVPIQLATLVATCLVGVLAYAIARLQHIPRTCISVPAVVIMIPGFTLYSAFSMMNAGDVTGAIVMAQEAVQVILAAGLGLALAHLATSPTWRKVGQPS